jgi:hypothetical protein
MILVSRKDKSVPNRKPQSPTDLNQENANFANPPTKTANYLLAQNEWKVPRKAQDRLDRRALAVRGVELSSHELVAARGRR